MKRALLLGGAALLWGAPLRADVIDFARPAELWGAWSADAEVLLGAALAALVYDRGRRRLGRRARRGRAWCFQGGLALLVLAIVSPLDAASAALFSAHMVQHLVLMSLVAPLLALGRPAATFWAALPATLRKRWAGGLRRTRIAAALAGGREPLLVLGLQTALLWAWHLPAWYEAAIASDFVHWLEHASFVGSSVLFWGVVVRGHWGAGVTILYLFAGATQGALLGALITLAPVPWYVVHASGAEAFGLSPLEDQQLAGLLMWIPGNLVHLLAVLIVMGLWLRQAEKTVVRRQPLWQQLAGGRGP